MYAEVDGMRFEVLVTRETVDNRLIVVDADSEEEARRIADNNAVDLFQGVRPGSDIASYSVAICRAPFPHAPATPPQEG